MFRFMMVCTGGFLGTGARYALDGYVSRNYGETFPIGTLSVNVIGSFLIGVLFVVTGPGSPVVVSATARQFLIAGVLGGFTTFSAFSLQTLTLVRSGQVLSAIGNVGLSIVAGILAAWAGEELARGIWIRP